jgi:hypothetical protein
MNQVPPEELFRGFSRARFRVERSLGSEDPWPLFFSVFEVLNWIVAFDSAIHSVAGTRKRKWWRDDEQGYLLAAVGYARNRVHHQWEHALRLHHRPKGGLPLFEGGFTWVWRDLDDLPRETRRSAREGKDAYGYMVRREPRVVYTLRDIEPTLREGMYAAEDAQ